MSRARGALLFQIINVHLKLGLNCVVNLTMLMSFTVIIVRREAGGRSLVEMRYILAMGAIAASTASTSR
jgi:hypothetical protein